MVKYRNTQTIDLGNKVIYPGNTLEVIKLKRPWKAGGKYLLKYYVPELEYYLSKEELKNDFVKVQEYTKPILKTLLVLALYEAVKYFTEQYIIYHTQNDDVEVPSDFDINDHIHLNNLKAEVSD